MTVIVGAPFIDRNFLFAFNDNSMIAEALDVKLLRHAILPLACIQLLGHVLAMMSFVICARKGVVKPQNNGITAGDKWLHRTAGLRSTT